ncbi:MAG: B12-binding domain-containing radical SAM protein [Candidatus Omnitrophica bacterium]|nr:B12-binding domain-containing radical SAM protein [Candidatus Omnitrophota bacterium]
MSNKLRVLLVYPNLMMKNLLPPAIGILTACLRGRGFEVGLFDTTYYSTDTENPDETRKEYLQVRSYDARDYGITVKNTDVADDFRKKVRDFRPNLIGVSVVEDTMPLALRLIKALGDDRPVTIFGGIYISYLKEKAFRHREIDIICLGEGEEAIVELCGRLKEKKDYADVKNLCLRRGDRIISNGLRPLIDLDKLPVPDYSLFEEKRFYSPMQGRMRRMLPLDFDRGCPYDCSFCASPAYREWYRKQNNQSYFRKKSVDRIVEEASELVKRHDLEFLYFNSDTFFTLKDDVFDTLLLNIKNKIGLPFWCQTRAETIDKRRIGLLKECGCDRITVGLEHGNEDFRRNIVGKRFSNKQFLEACDIINEAGLPLSVNNIIGFPCETRELIFDTIELNRKIRSDSVSVFIFYPYTGTRLYELCEEKGLIDRSVGGATLLHNSVIRNKNLSREHLNRILKTFCLYVRFPKERWDDIEKIESGAPGSDKIFRELSEEYQKKYF